MLLCVAKYCYVCFQKVEIHSTPSDLPYVLLLSFFCVSTNQAIGGGDFWLGCAMVRLAEGALCVAKCIFIETAGGVL